MTPADRPKEASMFERMNCGPQLLFSNNMTHYFTESKTPNGLLKKLYYPYKKFDASNRSS